MHPVALAVRTAFALEGARSDLGVVVLLVSDAEIAAYHERFLGTPGPTDVISWPAEPPEHEDALSEFGPIPKVPHPAAFTPDPCHPERSEGSHSSVDGPEPSPGAEHDAGVPPTPNADHSLGDVMVSCETARVQAEELGHSWEREVCVLAVHGVLHLLGWDDLAPGAQAAMQARVDEIVDAVGA